MTVCLPLPACTGNPEVIHVTYIIHTTRITFALGKQNCDGVATKINLFSYRLQVKTQLQVINNSVRRAFSLSLSQVSGRQKQTRSLLKTQKCCSRCSRRQNKKNSLAKAVSRNKSMEQKKRIIRRGADRYHSPPRSN